VEAVAAVVAAGVAAAVAGVAPTLRRRLGAQIDGASARDQAAAGQSFDQLDAYLAKMGNPYANGPQTQAPRFDPSFAALLQSQGVDPTAQAVESQMMNVQAGQQDAAVANLWSMLAAGAGADQQSRQAESQMGRNFSGNQIRETASGLNAGVMVTDQKRQEALDAQRLQVIMELIGLAGSGANVNLDSILGSL
jgi:hypothetical protein